MVTAIAANARIIPIIEEIPILPVAFRNQTRETIPSRIAAIARMPVRITHERMLRNRLTKPSQFFERRGMRLVPVQTLQSRRGVGQQRLRVLGPAVLPDRLPVFEEAVLQVVAVPGVSRSSCRTCWYRDSGSRTHRRTYAASAPSCVLPAFRVPVSVGEGNSTCFLLPGGVVQLLMVYSPRLQAAQGRSAGSSHP